MSALQEVLWRAEQARSSGADPGLRVAFRIEREVDREALSRAIETLVRRHESLRDGFLYEEVPGRRAGQVVRVPMPAAGLFHATLADGAFELRASRLVADERSLEILIDELNQIYAGARLPEPERTYTDFVAWHRSQVTKARRVHLDGSLPVVELPGDRSRALAADNAGAEVVIEVPAKSVDESVFLAAFMRMLARYTGEEDVVVATTVDLRAAAGCPGVVGCCSNTVLVRLNGEIPFEAAPAYQVRFEWLERAPAQLSFATRIPTEVDCDLTLRMWLDGDRCRGTMHYRSALFDPATVEDFAQHFLALVAGTKPGALSPPQSAPADYPRDIAMHQLIERQVARTPDAVALTFGGASLTYGELNRRANQLARYLRGQGTAAGTLVGLAVGRSVEMLVAVLAVLKAGGAYVPLDPSYPEERLAYMIQDSQMPLVIAKGRMKAGLPADPPRVVDLDADAAAIDAQDGADFDEPRAGPDDLAYVLYTSGSTGKPKGVEIPHRAVVNFLCSMAREPALGPDDVLLAVTTLSFDIAGLELFLPLTVGARIVLARSDEAAYGMRLRELVENGVTAMQATPATWRLLIEAGWQGERALKVLCGGEALSRLLADDLLKRCGSLWNMYGPTETTIWSTVWKVEAGDGPILIGQGIANTPVYVLDGQMQPVPAGVAGELYIGGDGLMRGYRNRPDLTAAALVEGPDGRAVYKTGDLVRRRRDGNLEFVGRIDQQVKWHGFRIELGEIEAALARHPQLSAAAALVREDVPGKKQLVAYCVARREPGPGAGELRRFVSGVLPPYMVPSAFVFLAELPRTPNGKTNRRALPAPAGDRPELAESYVAPRNPVEKRLAAIWQEVLGVARIGVTDNYFDLGAESLVTAQMFARIEREFGRRVSPAALFQAPTIEQLSRVLGKQDEGPARWSCLVPVVERGSKPALFCIHGGAGSILFFYDLARYLDDDRPVYALQAQGLYGGAPPHATVPEMAEHYLKEMRAVQERGPYVLVGYCFGAIVAYEMAQRLRAEGDEATLISLNGPSPRYRNVPGGKAAASIPRRARAYLRGWRRKIDRWRAAYYRRRNLPLPDALRDRYFLFNNHRAEHFYQARPYAGSMAIFRAKGLYGDAHLGWTELVQGGFTVCDIPGHHTDHRSMMEEPAVKLLAAELKRKLSA